MAEESAPTLKRKAIEALVLEGTHIGDDGYLASQIRNADLQLCNSVASMGEDVRQVVKKICDVLNEEDFSKLEKKYRKDIKKTANSLVGLGEGFEQDIKIKNYHKAQAVRDGLDSYTRLKSRYQNWLHTNSIPVTHGKPTLLIETKGYFSGSIIQGGLYNLDNQDPVLISQWCERNDKHGFTKLFITQVMNDGYDVDVSIDVDWDYQKKEWKDKASLSLVITPRAEEELI
jgi:hypothetical protein